MTEDYAERINRVLAYVDRNAGRNLSLEEIAEVGAFSPYHFHRVFKAACGETIHAYILRKRLALAVSCLRYRSDWDVTRVAMECGFASASDFSRAFRKAFGESPRAFRSSGRKAPSATAGSTTGRGALCEIEKPSSAELRDFESRFSISSLSDEKLAYFTCIGVSMSMDTPEILSAFKRLYRWSALAGMNEAELRFMGLVYDDPAITESELVRYVAALVLPSAFEAAPKPPRGASVDAFALAGSYVRFEMDRSSPEFATDYMKAIDGLFGTWMPANSLAPDAGPIVELYPASPDGRAMLSVHVPCRSA
jgi:AraC-type DNA-binding domain-containing proteins